MTSRLPTMRSIRKLLGRRSETNSKTPRNSLRIVRLEDRLAPSVTVIGSSEGGAPLVRVLDSNGALVHAFNAYDPSFLGGVDVDQGDVTGDGIADIITGAGPGGGPHVKVFDGVTYAEIRSFMAYNILFGGGVHVASGNLRSNGICDIITGAGAGGGPHVKVFDGENLTELHSFMAYDLNFTGGVSVASAQSEADFENDIITGAGPGGGPHVKAFDGVTGEEVSSFMAYDIAFRGGVTVASGDFDSNAVPDLVTVPTTGGGPHVKVWENSPNHELVSEFLALGGRTIDGLNVGSVDGADGGPDLIAVAPRFPSNVPADTHAFGLYGVNGNFVSAPSFGGTSTANFQMSSNPDAPGGAYGGTTQHGMVYSPTWLNWAQQRTGLNQLSDSDMANDAFRGLWDVDPTTGQGRRDLATIAAKENTQTKGFNLIRLFDWEPGRGWDGSKGLGHIAFLDKAQELGLKVIVPISNYFLSNDQYAWVNNSTNPSSNYDFGSAPQSMQNALKRFLSSVTVNGKIHPAVHSFAVGNELDLAISLGDKVNPTPPPPTLPADAVDSASKLARALWWIKNLRENMVQGDERPLSIPISNADQGSGPGQDKSWFQCILHGVKTGEQVPHGSVNGVTEGGTFAFAVTGLDKYDWYKTGFYNSYQVYQNDVGMRGIMQQYDNGGAGGKDWNTQWPGEKFDVPMLFTELGKSRAQLGQSQQQQFDWVTNQQARVVESYLRNHSRGTNIMGYSIFEYNDETDKHGPLGALDATFGVTLLVSQQYPVNGNILFHVDTGTTALPDGRPNYPSFSLPVYELFPVKNNSGTSLLSELKKIFNE